MVRSDVHVRFCEGLRGRFPWSTRLIITGDSKEWLETGVKPRVILFLASRGLQLSEEKTHMTHINKGFDFLGWNFRKYDGKRLTKLSDKSIKAILEKTGEIIRNNRQAKTANLILMLKAAQKQLKTVILICI